MLQEVCPRGLDGVFERFRGVLHDGEIEKRVEFPIEGLFSLRKATFEGYTAVLPELDLVEEEDQVTHEISLADDDIDAETELDVFRPDSNYCENESKYEELRKEILGEDESEEEELKKIKDETETDSANLRRTMYLTIMSSGDFEEAGQKLMQIRIEPGQEMEVCVMILECCSQERTYLRYYGLLGQRFCMMNEAYRRGFERCFVDQYSMIHRLETNKLRNVAKFFGHLLASGALTWEMMGYIRLTEQDTTSSSRIFVKILFQELCESLGLQALKEYLSDPLLQDCFNESIFPKDSPRNIRFCINFFTSIGLRGITDNMRDYLKNMH